LRDRLLRFSLQEEGWGKVDFLRPLPIKGDIWGDLAFLRGTDWEGAFSVIPTQIFQDALHGDPLRLLRLLGPPPEVVGRLLSEEAALCKLAQEKQCPLRKKICRPGPKKPVCYTPTEIEGGSEVLMAAIVKALSEGRYLIVVKGE
jgi:hypothetical protein